jgi:hypothetical protein
VSCSVSDSCIAGVPPPVAIIFTGNAQKVSPTAQVLFQSSGTQNSTLQWSGSRLLSDCNADPLERQLEFGLSGVLASSSVSRNLVFAERKLVPGGSYRIRLQATTGVAQSTAELLFTVNTSPENGTVRVVPSLGTAMENAFVISSDGWQDEDLPLMYSFATALGNDQLYPLTEPSTCNLTSAMLPQGSADHGFVYEVVGLVSDLYDATAQSHANVTVLAATPPSSWEDSIRTTLASIAPSRGCGDGVDSTQVLSSFAQSLNKQENVTADGLSDALRARELMVEFVAQSVAADADAGTSIVRTGSLIADLMSVPEQVTERLVEDALTVLQTITTDERAPTLSQSAATSIATSASNILVTDPSASHITSLQDILVQASAGVAARMVPGEDAAVVTTPAFELSVQRFGNDSATAVVSGGYATLPQQLLASQDKVDVLLVRWEINPFRHASNVPLGAGAVSDAEGYSISSKVTTLSVIGPDRKTVRVDGMEGITVQLPLVTSPLNFLGNCSACTNAFDVLHGDGACEKVLEEGADQRRHYPLADKGYSCATHFCSDCAYAGFCNKSCDAACTSNASNTSSARRGSTGSTCVLPPDWRCSYWDTSAARWRTDGIVLEANENATVCSFDHLTDFASVMGESHRISSTPMCALSLFLPNKSKCLTDA